MSKPDKKKKNIRASILDRLIDLDPKSHVDSEQNQYQQIRDLRESVKRDLESLLNTRYRIISTPEDLPQLENCILNYGLPDLATVNTTDIEKRKAFIRDLENLLRTYEPRFKSVSVTYQENDGNGDRTLRFRIDAILYADPAPEVVVFDSILEPVSRSVNIRASDHV